MSRLGDDELDAMLAASLTEVEDLGFSSRVAAKAASRTAWRERLWMAAPVLAAAVAAPFLPLDELTDAALHLAPQLANSAAVAAAAAVLALTLVLDAKVREAL